MQWEKARNMGIGGGKPWPEQEDTMFEFLRSPQDRHFIDNGRVYCPIRQKDTEIDICAGCPRVQQIARGDGPPYVRCQLESPLLRGTFYGNTG